MNSYTCLIVTHSLSWILYEILAFEIWPRDWPFKVPKVKCSHATGLPIYGFLLRSTSNIWPTLAQVRHRSLQNLNDLDFDLSRSLRVKCDGAIGLPIYDFSYIYVKSYTWPNATPLRDINLRNLSYLDIDLSRSPRSNCIHTTGIPMFNSSIWPILARPWDVCKTWVTLILTVQGHKVKCDDAIELFI